MADYTFYEGIEDVSAQMMVQQTTSSLSTLLKHIPKLAAYDAKRKRRSVPVTNSESNQDDPNETAVRLSLFTTLEELVENIALHIPPSDTDISLKAIDEGVNLQMNLFSTTTYHTQKILHVKNNTEHDSDSIRVASSSVSRRVHADSGVTVMSVFYEYPPPNSPSSFVKNINNNRVSNYVSMNVREFAGQDVRKISVPVKFTLNHPPRGTNVVSCGFLLPNDSAEEWDTYGCSVEASYQNQTLCYCNHTTNFAILMKFHGDEVDSVQNQMLDRISLALGSVSTILLMLTLATFLYFRRTLMKDRMIIHFHLILALCFGYLSLLLSTFSTSATIRVSMFCLMSAVMTHFFFLAVFCWYLVEGMYLFYKICMVFERRVVEQLGCYSPLIGWLLPLFIVIMSLGISRIPDEDLCFEDVCIDKYVNPRTCFLSTTSGIIWALVGPILFIIIVNALILCKVIWVIFKTTYRKSGSIGNGPREPVDENLSESLKKAANGVLVLMPVLGTPWIFGLFYNLYQSPDEDNSQLSFAGVVGTAGAYLQCISVGIQGILIFFYYCIFNKDVRHAYQMEAKKRRIHKDIKESTEGRSRSGTTSTLLPLTSYASTMDR